MGYKLELRGFPVEEKEFNVNQIAICPYCDREIGGTWQNLVIVEDRKSLKCQCGRDTNTNLAIAMAALTSIQKQAKKHQNL
jgi:RNA polymerase subunit RPABC4/transcription elongation factor Spt4